MSRPWNKSLHLHVDAQAALAQPLEPALEALLDALRPPGRPRQWALNVTVADACAHYDVVAGDYAAYSDPQLQAIAQGCVAELLGDAASQQIVRWQLQPDQKHLLLCAIEHRLVQALLEASAARQMSLVSLQPAFCRHWNACARRRASNGVFAVTDTGHSLVTCTRQHAITALSYGTDTGTALDLRADRLLASTGHSAEATENFMVLARNADTLALPPRWTVLDWPEETP